MRPLAPKRQSFTALPLVLTLVSVCASWVVPTRAATPPTVEFVTAPAPGSTVPYLVPFGWRGTDVDGVVSGFRFAIDPPVSGTPYWIPTADTVRSFFFATTQLQKPVPATGPVWFTQPHSLALEAVDNDGLESDVASRDFITSDIAPEVQITVPTPSAVGPVPIAPEVILEWQGSDADGVFLTKPVKYKYALFRLGTHGPADAAWADPEGFRDLVAPTFAGWDSVSYDSLKVSYRNLIVDQTYLFCLVGFDEAGAYSARFAPAINMIQMNVSLTPTLPRSWGSIKARYR